jgi:hypothetical protein
MSVTGTVATTMIALIIDDLLLDGSRGFLL